MRTDRCVAASTLLLLCGAAGLAVTPRSPAAVPAVAAAPGAPRRAAPPAALLGQASFEAKLERFAPSAELPELRKRAARLESDLTDAVHEQDFAAAAMLRDDLAELRDQDPACLAAKLREELEARVRKQHFGEAARLRDQLIELRSYLPQYQLAGLWKGNYPNHGECIVRLWYQGDTLLALKVTGDEHVPAGEVTFRADLTTPHHDPTIYETGDEDLVGVRVEVVSVSSKGTPQQREVERYGGEGRIAARGFEHAHFVPGQLFLIDTDVVGFLWLPLGTFVVFSRVDEAESTSVQMMDGPIESI